MSAGPASPKSDFAPAGPVCFVSTHLDDVVLSCSHFVAAHPGAVVMTVLAGAPDGAAGMWDRVTTRQRLARDAVGVRRDEDSDALHRLGATPVWLDLLDGQYESSSERDRDPIVREVGDVLDGLSAGAVVAPVGLFHRDHIAVAEACLTLAALRDEEFYLYLDMPYAQTFPVELADRIDRLGLSVEELSPFDPVDPTTKEHAVAAYASQLRWIRRGLAGFDVSMTDQERYWRVA